MQEKIQSFLNKVIDKWKSFEKSQKIKIIVIAAVLVAVLGATVYLTLRPRMYTIINNQDGMTILAAQSALNDANIPNQIINNGTGLQVTEGDVGNARLQLETKNVFSGKKFTYYDALEYSTMGTTDIIKNENLKKAKQTELETMISKMNGIIGADVQLVIPGDTNFFLPDNKATASVLLETEGQLDPGQAETVARLVQRSVKNLELENIEITDQNYNMLFSGVAIQTNGGLKTQFDAEMLMKGAIETQIKKAARPIYDETNTIFNLAFNWDKIQEQSKLYSNPLGDENASGLVDAEKINKQNIEGTNPNAEPGLGANNQQTPGYQTQDGGTSTASINEREANYIYNVVEQIKEGQIGNVLNKDSSIAVFVYRYSNFDEAYMTQNDRLNGQTWTDFKSATKPTEFAVDDAFITSLKIGTGIDNLSVVGYDVPVFVDKEVQPIAIQQIAILVILALLILLLAYGLLRKTQPDEVTEIEPELSVEDLLVSSQLDERQESETEKLRDIELGLESEVKRQINKFVDEKPDAVAQLLRNWLNEDWE